MLDKRISLKPGYQLDLNTETEYRIVQEAGRGAGCIVYDAGYADNLGLEHRVRIKECYPYYLELDRAENGNLVISEKEKEDFEKAKEKFNRSYKRNTALGNTLGLINSTVNVSNIYYKNNTVYTVMNYDEGTDFSHIVDKDLKSVFVRIRAVTEIIGKYHSKGFLHLDIKPENIMVIPETKEHIILFDFDSMIAKNELRAESFQLSFSDGFSAPEQVHGEIKKISEATDIYSLGALMFYKIFGRKADSTKDCALGAKFDFSKMIYPDKRYQPALFRKLEEFLHKTLSISIICRWKQVDQVLQSLDALIRLADFEHLFLYNNFNYNVGCFAGRKKELTEIKELLQEHQILFLHGIGGIGKTELAKRFIYENRSDFNNVVFVSFQGSILETVIGTDINIGNFEEEEQEDRGHYFNRKIEALKSILSKDDIILLDNFDVSDDNELETLLECPCKFLVTTREDFRDYNYPQLDIREMEEMEDILHLFCAYNSRKYKEQEMLCIKEIIDLVDRHTMTVELLAKYLRDSIETVFELRERLWENEGITGITDIHVRHRKDKQRHLGNISEHLLMLFELSDFSKRECELIKSLSLLGYLRINKKVFLNYCNCRDGAKDIERLIHKGWIEYEETMDKISLHQVILDLVYNHLKPNSESCSAITNAMTRYACMEMENRTDKDIRKKMLGLFLKRISGADDTLAEFYLSYCMHIKNEEFLLDKIEEICMLSESRKHYDFLRLVSMQRIKLLSGKQEWVAEDDDKGYFHKFAVQIAALADKSVEYMGKAELEDKDRIYFYAELGNLVSSEAGNVELYVFGEDGSCLDIMYTKAQELLEKAAQLMENENSTMTSEEKINIYKKILAFYQDMDFSAAYRSEHYGDKEKLLYFSDKVEEEKRKGRGEKEYISSSEVTYETCGDNAAFQGEHKKAIVYYEKAVEASESRIESGWILSKLAKEYEKTGEYGKAEECLLGELKIDEELGTDISYTCNDLADLFIRLADFSKATEYCDRVIRYQEQKIGNAQNGEDRENYQENKIWLIAFYEKKSRMAEGKEKESYYKKCLEVYRDYHGMDSRICSFLEIMCKREMEGKDIVLAAEKVLNIVKYYLEEREYECAERMVSLLLSADGRALLEGNEEILVEALCYCCDIFFESEAKEQRALECCLEAEKMLSELKVERKFFQPCLCQRQEQKAAYLHSLVFAKQGKAYDRLGDYEKGDIKKRKCNYYLLAEIDAQGTELEKQFAYWEDAAEVYFDIDKYADAEHCFQQLFALFDPVLGQYPYSSFEHYWRVFGKRIQALSAQGLVEDVYKRNTELYLKTVDFYQGMMLLALQKGEKGQVKETDRVNKDFCWRLKEIAENYNKALYYYQAVVIYFLKLIMAAGKEMEEAVLRQIVCFDGETEKDIMEEVIKLLKREDISKEMVDIVVDIFGKVQEIDKKIEKRIDNYNRWLGEVMREYKVFTEVYQYGEVAFKR